MSEVGYPCRRVVDLDFFSPRASSLNFSSIAFFVDRSECALSHCLCSPSEDGE